MFSRTGQIGQVIITVFILIVVVGLLFFGYFAIKDVGETKESVDIVKLENDLELATQAQVGKFGSIETKSFYVPSAIEEVCFVDMNFRYDLWDERDKIPELFEEYGIVGSAVESGVEENVFLFSKSGLEESFVIEGFSLPCPWFGCVKSNHGRVELELKGVKDYTELGFDDWNDNHALCNEPPVAVIRYEPDLVTLNTGEVTLYGDRSSDPEGGELRYLWEIVVPAGPTLSNDQEVVATFTPLMEVDHKIKLTVWDEFDEFDEEVVVIPVSDCDLRSVNAFDTPVTTYTPSVLPITRLSNSITFIEKVKRIEGGEMWVRTEGELVEVPAEAEYDVVLTTDLSSSMAPPEGGLIEAKQANKDFIEGALEDNGAGLRKVGLVSFSDTARKVHPLSTNKDGLITAVELYGAGGGTNYKSALEKSQVVLADGHASDQYIIFLSDGAPTRPDGDLWSNNWVTPIKDAGIVVFTIGVGEAVDEERLRYIADETGGSYYYAAIPNLLGAIYAEILGNCGTVEVSNPAVNFNVAGMGADPDWDDTGKVGRMEVDNAEFMEAINTCIGVGAGCDVPFELYHQGDPYGKIHLDRVSVDYCADLS